MDKAQLHRDISFAKSAVRCLGYVFVMVAVPTNGFLVAAGVALILAEVLGVAEEIWGA